MENRTVQVILAVIILAVAGTCYLYSRDFVAGLHEVHWYKFFEVSRYSVRLLAPIPIVALTGYLIYRRIKSGKSKNHINTA